MATWRCIQGCGACCYLNPSERPDLSDYLTSAQLQEYLKMVGTDGWCIHFDSASRQCRIYEQRPRFCRVEAETFQEMYGIEPSELDEFAIACCVEQIEDVYGDRSLELLRFQKEVSDNAGIRWSRNDN